MTVSMHKTLAALHLPTPVPALLGVAEAIVLAMSGNPSFPAPTPAIATVASALADLQAAEVATLTRARGTAAARNEKRAALVALLMRLKAYVQGVADEDPERAEALIHSAGMNVKKLAPAAKPVFDARPGAVSGSVRLAVRAAGDRASYQWGWSADGGTTWRSAPATVQARTVISGLASGSICALRYRVVTTTGEGDWSEPVLLLVR
jgi:hypothetical protein